MKTLILNSLIWTSALLFSCTAEKPEWPEITREAKPWTRWWWMENAVDQQNLTRELEEMAAVGIGGVEITPIYGVKGEEDRFIEFLTPEFSTIVNFAINEANRLDLGVDLPPGSGWRCGGPFVPEEKGLWSLQMEKKEMKKGEHWVTPGDITVASASFVSSDQQVTLVQAGEPFIAPDKGILYMAVRIKNRDKVKRPSKGGEGWAIDTFNEEITNWYLDEFWKSLGVEETKIRCFFHDSFEYTGDFTTHFTEEFKKRRGYDLAAYLYVLAGDCTDPEIVARVKSDYRETLSDLVLESFIQPMTDWANRHKSLNRNQAHGSPGNILDLYAACDIPETEIFRTVTPGTVDVFVNKFASSAAHVTGQKLVSSESFTWLEEHWTVTPSDMVRATNRFFLAGVNHMFFHGTCYSPSDAEWPGWLFYASTQMNNRNPLWRELPALFDYIGRSQAILQNAGQQNDILVYWPYYDVAAGEGRLFNHIGVNKDAGWFRNHPISELSEKLTRAGYTFDYISDKLLQECTLENGSVRTPGGSVYQAVVITQTRFIPLETLNQLYTFYQGGGKVFFDNHLPESVPGVSNLESRKSALENIKKDFDPGKCAGDVPGLLVSSNINGEKSMAENGLRFLKMNREGETWYMVFNCGLEPVDAFINIGTDAKNYVLYDPMSGEITLAERKGKTVHLQLDEEKSVFVRCAEKRMDVPKHAYIAPDQEKTGIKGLWKVEFKEGGPVFPGNIQMDDLMSWTKAGDPETERFAGTAKYAVEFNHQGSQTTAILDLGVVKDCARVILNGVPAGTVMGPSYRIRVDNLIQGKNLLEVEVTNVAANRIRDMDIRGVEWRKFYDINLVNIEYQPFDASGWEVKEAGILGPVELIPLANP